MTSEQYDKATKIKNMIFSLERAVRETKESGGIELYCEKSSSKYSLNKSIVRQQNESEIFKIMQDSIIKGLQNKITELKEEFNNL